MKKHKLLYIPSGELIEFCSNSDVFNTSPTTMYFEDSLWLEAWPETLSDVVKQFCDPLNEIETKTAHKIPLNVELSSNEFEWIEEEI